MRYYFRHVTKNAYANQNHELVSDWRDAASFTAYEDAETFYELLGSYWDMCECSEEQWEATGGRLTPPHKGITISVNGEVVFRQEEI